MAFTSSFADTLNGKPTRTYLATLWRLHIKQLTDRRQRIGLDIKCTSGNKGFAPIGILYPKN